MFKRDLFCSNCHRKIESGEKILARMIPPKHNTMVGLRAYLEKKAVIICKECKEK